MYNNKLKKIFIFNITILIFLLSSITLMAQVNLEEPFYTYKALGDKSRHSGNYEKAINMYEKALSIRIDYPECYYWLAYVLKEQEKFNLALYEIDLAIEYENKFEFPIFKDLSRLMKAEIFYLMNKKTQAKKILMKLVTSKRFKNNIGLNNKFHGRIYFMTGLIHWIDNDFPNYFRDNEEIKDTSYFFNRSRSLGYKPKYNYYFLYIYTNELERKIRDDLLKLKSLLEKKKHSSNDKKIVKEIYKFYFPYSKYSKKKTNNIRVNELIDRLVEKLRTNSKDKADYKRQIIDDKSELDKIFNISKISKTNIFTELM